VNGYLFSKKLVFAFFRVFRSLPFLFSLFLAFCVQKLGGEIIILALR